MRVHRQGHACLCICRGQRRTSGVPLCHPMPYCLETGPLTEPKVRLAVGKPRHPPVWVKPRSEQRGFTGMAYVQTVQPFPSSPGYLDSGLHVCAPDVPQSPTEGFLHFMGGRSSTELLIQTVLGSSKFGDLSKSRTQNLGFKNARVMLGSGGACL